MLKLIAAIVGILFLIVILAFIAFEFYSSRDDSVSGPTYGFSASNPPKTLIANGILSSENGPQPIVGYITKGQTSYTACNSGSPEDSNYIGFVLKNNTQDATATLGMGICQKTLNEVYPMQISAEVEPGKESAWFPFPFENPNTGKKEILYSTSYTDAALGLLVKNKNSGQTQSLSVPDINIKPGQNIIINITGSNDNYNVSASK